jgi:hypothetical protein
MEQPIVNRVSNSSLVVFDLEELYTEGERVQFDIKDLLFQGLICAKRNIGSYKIS